VTRLHERYGAFVRISPNHVSIASPVAMQQVYGPKTGFLKGPFYDDEYSLGILWVLSC